LDAVGSAMVQTMGECLSPDEQEELSHPPDSWSADSREKFDLLSEFEQRACRNIEKVLDE